MKVKTVQAGLGIYISHIVSMQIACHRNICVAAIHDVVKMDMLCICAISSKGFKREVGGSVFNDNSKTFC